ncbi:MAG: proline dehydrogenase family protein [Planctomycetota bacterium]
MRLLDRLAIATLPYVPKPLMRPLAGRYIAGETLGEALERLEALAERGHPGILDVLGEDVASEAAARGVAKTYIEAAHELARRRLDAYVSIKPTHLGLRLGEQLCFELYDEVARATAELGLALRVEMEDHTTTDGTLRVFERLRAEHPHVGIVLQSRLVRTPADIAALAPGPLWVRMVKGIYLEPAAIAHTENEPICEAYVACTRQLFERGASVSCATHDEFLAERLIQLVEQLDVPRERFEFQVLLGVREPLWELWREAGHTVRVYVPYGPEWKPYSVRRLQKNPQIFGHVMRDLLPWR